MRGRNNQVVGMFKQTVKVSFSPLKFSVLEDSVKVPGYKLGCGFLFLLPFSLQSPLFPSFLLCSLRQIVIVVICLFAVAQTDFKFSVPSLPHLSLQRQKIQT